MRILYLFYLLILIQFQVINAQEITAKILDANTRQPIPYATIQYAPYRGVITNEEGTFSIQARLNTSDSLHISSLGYEPYNLSLQDIKEIILLKPSSIHLEDVFLSDKNLTGQEIVERVKQKVKTNYNFGLSEKRFFFRESNINNIKQFHMKVDNSTFPDLDQDLMDRISNNIPKISDSYKEVLGDFYGNYDSQKINIIKAANLHNPQSTASLTELTDKLQKILQDNIKDNSKIKIKSGIFGVKVDADELEEDWKEEQEESKVVVEKTPAEIQLELEEKQKNLKSSTQRHIKELVKNTFWQEDIIFDLLEKMNRYKFTVDGYVQLDNSISYIISFEPKRGADFKGKMYVNTEDFGVHRIDYYNVKPLEKFRLLGISTSSDIYKGKMIFKKDQEGKYNPQYMELEKGESFGIDRPLTIIEKNRFVAGKNRQNELDLDIKINVGQVTKYELVVYESQPMDEQKFSSLETDKAFELETFKVYNAAFWDGYNIIEPNAAIRAFTAVEQGLFLD